MSPEFYATFLQQMGHTIRESSGVYWYDVLPRVWTCFPAEVQLNPATVNLSEIMDRRGLMARYCCRVEDGVSSFRHVNADRSYNLQSLDSKSRNQTRRGLENCTSGPEEGRELGDAGIELHLQTFRRQGRKLSAGFESYWRKYFEAVSQCPAATVWVTRCQGVLASFLISFRIGSVENICIIRSNEELLRHRPNNAMLFTFLQHAFSRSETSEVCIGLQSLQAGMGSLDAFKRAMGFEERPTGQRIELRSAFGFSVPRMLAKIAGKAVEHVHNEYAARLAGALSLYANQPMIRRTAIATR